MSGFNGKTQGFQRLSKESVGFALVQLNSQKVALFSGDYEAKVAPDFTRPLLFAPHFFRSGPPAWWEFENFEILDIDELEDWAKPIQNSEKPLNWEEPSYADFSAQVRQIETAFEDHRLHKAVPTVFAECPKSQNDPSYAQLLANAVFNRGHRNLYALVMEGEGIIGATPEILFQFDSNLNEVRSMALAGTRATELEKDLPLLNDPKELHEHNLVMFEIKEKLSAFGKVFSNETFSWDIGALTHLRTDILTLQKSCTEPAQLFSYLDKALHPTPALGVSSETIDFTWLKTLSGAKERYRFGAPFGVWSQDYGAQVFVAIRNIQWTEKKWLLGSGCGYVPQSTIDKEWKELELKRASVKNLFEAQSD